MQKNKNNKDKKVKVKKGTILAFVLIAFFVCGLGIGKYLFAKINGVSEAAVYADGNHNINNKNSSSSSKENPSKEGNKPDQASNDQGSKKQQQVQQDGEKGDFDTQPVNVQARIIENNSITSINYNYSVNLEDAYKQDGKKVVFLTFDDGPSRNVTPQILDILKKYNVKATFFIVGSMAVNNKDIIQRIYNEGNSIGNHSYTHVYQSLYANANNFWDEINKTNEVLKQALGQQFKTRLFRFPGGSTGGEYESLKAVYRKAITTNGYGYIDWNVVSGDATGNGVPPETLLENVIDGVKGKEHAVILMHDLCTKSTTAEALPSIIEYLKGQGYEFKVLK